MPELEYGSLESAFYLFVVPFVVASTIGFIVELISNIIKRRKKLKKIHEEFEEFKRTHNSEGS